MSALASDGSISFYFFDIDDNLVFLPTKLYLWNAETQTEMTVTSGEFAGVQSELGRAGKWQAWAIRAETFRDFRDQPNVTTTDQSFVRDLRSAIAASELWQGPSWPLLVHAAERQRPIACVTARNVTHTGMVGFYPMMAAQRGLIGLSCNNGPTILPPCRA